MADTPADQQIDLDPLTGSLVRLRELREEDLPLLIEWWNDPGIAAYQRPFTQPKTHDGIAEMIRGWSRNDAADCGFSIVKRKGGELVGQASLFGATTKDRCALFAIVVGTNHQNRGYGTEATRLLLRYGFAELGLHRIELNVYSFNSRAMAAYAKAGFREEGRRRESVWRSGAWHDSVGMAVLRHEWEELERAGR
ncbi:GNAT family N-acetyltransferase [Flindersiella endophytica]